MAVINGTRKLVLTFFRKKPISKFAILNPNRALTTCSNSIWGGGVYGHTNLGKYGLIRSSFFPSNYCCPALSSRSIHSSRATFIAAASQYDKLGISNKARPEEIKSAYYELAKKHHPDTNKQDPNAAKKFHELHEAYEVLRNPAKRASNDLRRGRGSSSREQSRKKNYDDDDILFYYLGCVLPNHDI